jgi:hypothetical protein
VDAAQFEAIFRKLVSPEKIRVSSELGEPAEIGAIRSTMAGEDGRLPSFEALENIALKRELRSKRLEIARALEEAGTLAVRCTELEAKLAAAGSQTLRHGQDAAADARSEAPAIGRPSAGRGQTSTVLERRPKFSEVFLNHTGYSSDKWSQFLPIYDAELQPMVARGRPLRLLEIGVQNGGSLQIWHEYLPEGSRIYGIDHDERCRRLAFPPETRVLIGNAGNPVTLSKLLDGEIFDIIIDDGSHQPSDITSAFEALLPSLAPGGKYFIEDLHGSYWPSHGGSSKERDGCRVSQRHRGRIARRLFAGVRYDRRG